MLKNCLITIIFLLFIFGNVLLHQHEPGDDLSSSYVGSKVLMEGQKDHLYNYDPTFFHVIRDPVWTAVAKRSSFHGMLHPYVQAPLWALALRPLCRSMEFPAFKLLFLILEFASLAGIVWLTAARWAPQFLDPRWLAVLLVVLSYTTPVQYMAYLAQTHSIFILATLAAILLADRKQPVWAGLLLALAAMVKITPGIFAIYWLITRQWSSAASFVIWMLALAAISVAALGWQLNLDYLANLHRVSNTWLVAYNNQSFAAWNFAATYPPAELFNWRMRPLPIVLKMIGYCLEAAVCIFLGVIYSLKPDRKMAFHPLGISALLVVSTLAANIAWSHYYLILVVPFMIIAADAWRRKESAWIVLLAAVVVLNLWPVSLDYHAPKLDSVTIIRSQSWAGVICLTAVLVKLAILFKRPVSDTLQ